MVHVAHAIRLNIKVLLIRTEKKVTAFFHPAARTADAPVSHRRTGTGSASRQGNHCADPQRSSGPAPTVPRHLKEPPHRAYPPEHPTGHPSTVPGAQSGPGHAPAPARTAVEAQLQKLWQAEFGRPVVGIHDDFFVLGGDSERAARLQHMVNGRFGLALPNTSVLLWPTIAELAGVIESCGTGAPRPTAARRKHHGRKNRLFAAKPVLPWAPRQRDRAWGDPW
ncbi:phosphopantetheine-binding protein [Streptomyces sp. NPDC005728]|uniref:acyl carrier protein n=1 Tax=Streptomyces sp. NPDC005728 TaxID=3157054 RepID=UPI0033F72BB7